MGLRRFAVINRLHHGKDLCLWNMEQQRRQLAAEVREAHQWLGHMEGLLDRYADALAHVCYFCSEVFSAETANTRCFHNRGMSPRSGRALVADPRVPPHLWGEGVHFWVQNAPFERVPMTATFGGSSYLPESSS